MKRSGRRVGRAQALGRHVGKSRPYGQRQTPEVALVATASKEDIHHLNVTKGRQHEVIGTPKGLPHRLTLLECHHLGHPHGHAPRHLNVLPPHWCGGIKARATYHRYVAHVKLFIQRENVEGGVDRPLPHHTRHINAAVNLPQPRGRPRLLLPGEVGLVPHVGGDVAYSQVPKHLAYPLVLPTAEEGEVHHLPLGDGVEGLIHPPDGRPYGRHATTVDSVEALFDNPSP